MIHDNENSSQPNEACCATCAASQRFTIPPGPDHNELTYLGLLIRYFRSLLNSVLRGIPKILAASALFPAAA